MGMPFANRVMPTESIRVPAGCAQTHAQRGVRSDSSTRNATRGRQAAFSRGITAPTTRKPTSYIRVRGITGQTTTATNADRATTCTRVVRVPSEALDPDTGKLKWYFQFTSGDTHDWDSTQLPVLMDGELRGQRRKM